MFALPNFLLVSYQSASIWRRDRCQVRNLAESEGFEPPCEFPRTKCFQGKGNAILPTLKGLYTHTTIVSFVCSEQNLRYINKAERKGLEPLYGLLHTYRLPIGGVTVPPPLNIIGYSFSPWVTSSVYDMDIGETPYWTHIVLQRVYRETTPAVTLCTMKDSNLRIPRIYSR